jgi:hypothetical protein
MVRLARFASRTPAPPPPSGMNSTPAFSRAATSASPIRLEAGRKALLTRTGRAPVIVAAPAIMHNDERW